MTSNIQTMIRTYSFRSGINREMLLSLLLGLMSVTMLTAPITLHAQVPEVVPQSITENTLKGYTEPSRLIKICAPENGLITYLDVQEGDTVEEGKWVASLETDYLLASLKTAQARATAQGRITSAEAELSLRKMRVVSLEKLLIQKHARIEEVERARADLEVANANLLSLKEEKRTYELQVDEIQAQLTRRRITTPISGVVVSIDRDLAEFVTLADPTICTVAQLDPLRIVLHGTVPQVSQFRQGQSVTVRIVGIPEPITAQCETISPIVDPSSGTIKIKLKIPNPTGSIRSGLECEVRLNASLDTVSRVSSSLKN